MMGKLASSLFLTLDSTGAHTGPWCAFYIHRHTIVEPSAGITGWASRPPARY